MSGAPKQQSMAPHMQALAGTSGLVIKEKARALEALSAIIGQEFEMGNRYQILTKERHAEIFYAAEETNCFLRQLKQCFPDCTPWTVNIIHTQGGRRQYAYKLSRDASCTCCCFNRPVVDVIDMTTRQSIGSIQDPCACCDLTFTLRGPDGAAALRANGGCCQWGLCLPLPCGPCSEVNFPITDAQSGAQVGHMRKKVPGCCKWFFASDVDNYEVDFGGVRSPQYKALVMALAIFTDFRFFNDNSSDSQGGLLGAFSGAE